MGGPWCMPSPVLLISLPISPSLPSPACSLSHTVAAASQTSAKGKDGTCNAKSKIARVKLETWCTYRKGSQGCGCPFCHLPAVAHTCASGRGTGSGSAGAGGGWSRKALGSSQCAAEQGACQEMKPGPVPPSRFTGMAAPAQA